MNRLSRKLSGDQSGVVLITVIIVIVIISVVVVSVMSMNVSQVRLTQDQYKSLQSQLLAESEARRVAAEFQAGLTPVDASYTMTVNGAPYTVSLTMASGGIYGSSVIAVDVDY